jgi:hypothetical protein
MGPQAGLDVLQKKKISARDRNRRRETGKDIPVTGRGVP